MRLSAIVDIALCALILPGSPLAGAAMSIARPVMPVDARAHYKGGQDIRLGWLHVPGQVAQ
ncbi:MAG: hypothetical protein Q8J70_00095 [Thiobacillus sp.]|nr:hypothetical protein [Thiobacillus sp.]